MYKVVNIIFLLSIFTGDIITGLDMIVSLDTEYNLMEIPFERESEKENEQFEDDVEEELYFDSNLPKSLPDLLAGQQLSDDNCVCNNSLEIINPPPERY